MIVASWLLASIILAAISGAILWLWGYTTRKIDVNIRPRSSAERKPRERFPAKEEVAGSIPAGDSIIRPRTGSRGRSAKRK